MKTLSKRQAIEAMQNGKKVQHKYFTHKYFTSDEWMKLNNDGNYVFEDGVISNPNEFWQHRNGKEWQTDWCIIDEPETTMKEIQEAIKKGKIDKVDFVNYELVEYPGEFLYCYDKSELLHLLSQVAERQRHDCQIEMDKRSIYVTKTKKEPAWYLHVDDIANTPLITDKLQP